MSCILSNGYVNPTCDDAQGGMAKAYIGAFVEDLTYTYGTNSVVEGFSGGTVSYYEFQQKPEVGEVLEAWTKGDNGNVICEQTCTLTFKSWTNEVKNIIRVLSQRKNSVVILDNNGVYHLMGIERGVWFREANGGAGKVYDDLSGYTVTLYAREKIAANEVNQTLAQLSLNAST